MEARKEAVLLIPGLMDVRHGELVQLLTTNLSKSVENVRVTSVRKEPTAGHEAWKLSVRRSEEDPYTIDFFEAYWYDLVPHVSLEDLWTKFKRGTDTLLFWMLSPIWRGVRGRAMLTFSLAFTAAVVLLWYVSTSLLYVATLLSPLGEGGTVSSLVWASALIATVLTTIGMVVPIGLLVDISDFSRVYLKNEPEGGDVALRHTIRNRVVAVLDSLVAEGTYDRITVVAHSFGCAVAVDVLADYPDVSRSELRMLTLGGPLELFGQRARWIREEIDKVEARETIMSWTDFYADGDWYCTMTPFKGDKGVHVETGHEASLLDKLTGRTHRQYFFDQRVLEALVSE